MFETYILPVLIFAAAGLISGILLTAASRTFASEGNGLADKVKEALPQVNCGACGYSGCGEYAKAVAENGERTDLCRVGGEKTAAALSEIMGVEQQGKAERYIALVRCSGDWVSRKNIAEFNGEMTCAGAKLYYDGGSGCRWGCLGLGDCERVCIADAAHVKDGLASIDRDKCVGCGLCAKTCPKGIIEMKRLSPSAEVFCSSEDKGKAVRAVCEKGCIGCGLCEKQCAFDAIHLKNSIPHVDRDKCTACGKCAEKCPAKVIHIRG